MTGRDEAAATTCPDCAAGPLWWHQSRGSKEWTLVDRMGIPHRETCPLGRRRPPPGRTRYVAPGYAVDTYRPYPGPFREDADD